MSSFQPQSIQQLRRDVEELKGAMVELDVTTQKLSVSLRQEITLLASSLALTRRMGLSEDINEGIARIQRLITTLNALRVSILAVQAASGPIGWGLAAVGIAASFVSVVDLIESETRGR